MWSHLERGSSPVDWCESNYSISPLIAEFVNTISNFLFFLLPPILVHLFQEYAKFVNPAINILWVLLMVVGLSSAYFHATLSLVGQLLDEFSILWLYVAALVMFLPRRHFPRFVKGSRRVFGIYGAVATVLFTGMMVLYPAANAFALLTLFVPTVFYMAMEISRVKCVRVYRLGLRCLAVGILAVFCWVLDRMFCETWLNINFPYMHGLWHIFIYISSSTAMVVGAYVSANEERPEQKVQLKYWPINEFELGVPYISVRNPCKKNDDNIEI